MYVHTLTHSLTRTHTHTQRLHSELQMASSDSNSSGAEGRSQMSPGGMDTNEIIPQLLEHIVALKLVSY